MTVPLTSLSHGAGCGCKLSPAALSPLLQALPASADPALLVDASTSDDAAVYRLSDEVALVQTVDFFTPIVDDPYDFGAIAATNALSDIYAMGATPLLALNLVAFPLERLGSGPLEEILRGGADAAAQAGVAIAGGHSIDDPEPKYGLAVTGIVSPERLLTNAGGQPGDVLVLSKPLGAGVAATAAKRGIEAGGLTARATAVMRELNREAADRARAAGAHALTDVTGFGLLGHLHELARASGVAAEISAGAVPAIDGVQRLLRDGADVVAGGTRRNRAHAETFSSFDDEVEEHLRWLVCDAMTSGGLLAAVAPDAAALASGVAIGRLCAGAPGTIRVRG